MGIKLSDIKKADKDATSPTTAAVGDTGDSEEPKRKQLYTPKELKAHTLLLYGPSGSLKSWNAIQFCWYVLQKTGKICRYVYCDEGGTQSIKAAEDSGLIQAVYVGQGESSMAMASKLSRGEWPKKKMVNGEEQIVWTPFSDEDAEEIGGYVFDSVTSLCNLVMQEVSKTGKHLAGDPKDHAIKFNMFGETIANYTRANYTIAQFVARTVFTNISNLPVEKVLITARESKGEDQEGSTIYGPSTAGKALIKDTPAAVGDIFHLTVDVIDEGTPQKKLDFRTYFIPHPTDVAGINWFAKPRLEGEALRSWFEQHPQGYFSTGEFAEQSIATYLEHQDTHFSDAVASNREKVLELMKKRKGEEKAKGKGKVKEEEKDGRLEKEVTKEGE